MTLNKYSIPFFFIFLLSGIISEAQLYSGTVSPSSQTISCGATPAALTATAASDGYGMGSSWYNYQWQSSTNGTSWSDISGATSGSGYSPGALTVTTYYRLRTGHTLFQIEVTSNVATVTVSGSSLDPGTISPSSASISYNSSPGQLTGSTPTGGTGSYTYQWYSSTNGTVYTSVSGATSINYTPGNLLVTTYFKRFVESGSESGYTNISTVSVANQLLGGVISPASTAINYSTTTSAISPSAATGGTGSYTYSWQYSEDSIIWNNISGAASSTYTPSVLYSTTFFRRSVAGMQEEAFTNPLKIIVYPVLGGGIITPGNKIIASNTSPGALGGVPATGGNGSYTYAWYYSTDGINWTSAGVTTQNYTPGNLTVPTFFKRIVTSNSASATSSVVKVSMLQGIVSGPAISDTTKYNYIRVWEATRPEQNATILTGYNIRDVKQTTDFYDGLGRKIQTVVKQGSIKPGDTARDYVNAYLFDTTDRQTLSFLPFAANSAGGNSSISDGGFKRNPFVQQKSFCTAQYPADSFFYSKTVYEQSGLDRVLKQMPEGNSWVGSGTGTEVKYWTNTTKDSVRIWKVTNVSGSFGTYNSPGVYSEARLLKNVTIDEHGRQVIEFKDLEDKIILRKVQNFAVADTGAGSGHTGWISTYYIYDDINNLRCVIQPEGIDAISSGWALTDTSILNNLCFRYEYDSKNRQIKSRVPGAGAQYVIYDKWDREVLSQTASQRTKAEWLFTKYDEKNRPIYTGRYINTTYTTQESLASYIVSQNMARFEDYTPSSSAPMYSLTNSFPSTTYSNVLTVNFYDNYEWTSQVSAGLRTIDLSMAPDYFSPDSNFFPFPQPVQQDGRCIGQITGNIVKSLESSPVEMIKTTFYDENGKIIQTKFRNYTGGIDIATTQYSFSGHPLVNVITEQKSGTNSQTHTTATIQEYDDLQRLIAVKKLTSSSIGGVTYTKPLDYLLQMEYDAAGRLKAKRFKGQPQIATRDSYGMPIVIQDYQEALESVNFQYNIRGWLLNANKNYLQNLTPGTGDGKYFGYEIGYDKSNSVVSNTAFGNQQLNGNISGVLWRSAGDGEYRKYDFAYDAMNRLITADFNQLYGSSWNKINPANGRSLDFSMRNTAYTSNGNFITMQQFGWKTGNSTIIDNLEYTYKANSNQLLKVIDKASSNGKLGDFTDGNSATANDYVYDVNGNMIADSNKNINNITYNLLDLPDTVSVSGKGNITFTYDATGTKIKKVVSENGRTPVTTLYLGNCVYSNDTLQYISNEAGQLRFSKKYFLNGDSTYGFFNDFFVKDYLDNVRMVLTDQLDTTKYLASLETAYRAKEEKLFRNIAGTAFLKSSVPGGFPADGNPITSPSDYVAKLDGANNRVGPAIVLKVMSGDVISMATKSYYKSGGTAGSNVSPLADILTSIATGITGVAGELKGSVTQLSDVNNSPVFGAINSFMQTNNPDQPTKPKAYLNWILLDEQFNYVGDDNQSYAIPVGTADQLVTLGYSGLNIKKSGYLYVYVSNETPNWPVYFDDVSISHYTGPMLEESHYYPYGLKIAGLNSKAFNARENKVQFHSKEKQDKEFAGASGLDWVDFGNRMYDPQIGSWHVIDKAAEKMRRFSVYNYAFANPVRFVDPDGMEPTDIVYFDFNAREIMRIKSNTEFRTFVVVPTPLKTPFLVEAPMPMIYTEKLTALRRKDVAAGKKAEVSPLIGSRYQKYDYKIAAVSAIFNMTKSNLQFYDEGGHEIPKSENGKIPYLNPDVLKRMLIQESDAGRSEKNDIMSVNKPKDWGDGWKKVFGLKFKVEPTPERSIEISPYILVAKGFKKGIVSTTDPDTGKEKKTYTWTGEDDFDMAAFQYNGRGVANYLESLTHMLRTRRQARNTDYE